LQTLDNRLRAADPDLADTVRRILDEPRTQSEAVPSSQKTIEIWNTLWASWADHVAEVGDEVGSYVNHEEHWHPPYFDLMALRDDLDKAAGPLSEWIDHAFPLVKEPDLFLESLVEINENMRSFPDWFQPVDDNLVLGPRASSCALRWIWLGLANQSESGRQLVKILCSLEITGQHTELHRNVCCQFFTELPEGVCREIHACLREAKFGERVANVSSIWHRIQHEYESRFDPSAHLQTCEQHLELDWHYGEPLIADAVSRQDLAAAEKREVLGTGGRVRYAVATGGDASWRLESSSPPLARPFPKQKIWRGRCNHHFARTLKHGRTLVFTVFPAFSGSFYPQILLQRRKFLWIFFYLLTSGLSKFDSRTVP